MTQVLLRSSLALFILLWISRTAIAQPGASETPPFLLSQIHIQYPDLAKTMRVEGRVMLSMLIDTTGEVSEIKVERTDSELLNEAAIAAMKNARFRPATYMGKPERVRFQQMLTFTLSAADTATSIHQPLADAPPVPVKPLSQLIPYPPDAKAAGIEGWVTVNALVDTTGNVVRAEVVESSLPAFEAAALSAMESAKFISAVENGKRVQAWYRPRLNFTLPSEYVPGVVGRDPNITAAPELLIDLQPVLSKTLDKPTQTRLRLFVAENGVVMNALALDKNLDAESLTKALNAGYEIPFAPGMIGAKVDAMWTDVVLMVVPAK